MKKLLFTVILFHLIIAPVFAHHNGIHHHHTDLNMHHCMVNGHYHGHQNNLNRVKPKHLHTHVTIVDFFLAQNPKILSILDKNKSFFSLSFWLPKPLLKDFFHPPQI